MLIDQLRADAVISRYFCDECKENDVSIEIDNSIDANDIVIIKVDDYYNANVHPQPKSLDCLIIQRCSDNTYILYLVELRNIDGPGGFSVPEITAKFNNCLDDFMSHRFAHYFHHDQMTYKNIHLIFISDPYNFKNTPVKQEKMKGTKIDALIAQRIPKYFGKHLYIDHRIPDPKINSCRAVEA